MQQSQLKYICSYSPAYNAGRADAALQVDKSYDRFNKCQLKWINAIQQAYNEGYDHYTKHEKNKRGLISGTAGFGAGINFVCVGTLFGESFIGKGQNQTKAESHVMANCNASDHSVHCGSAFMRCRRVNYGDQL